MNNVPFVGAQGGAAIWRDQDPNRLLDRLQGLAGVNALQVNVLDYYMFNPHHKAAGASMPDTPVWFRPGAQAYRDLPFAHAPAQGRRHEGADILAELIPLARARGIAVHARILEGFKPITAELIPGFAQVHGVLADGTSSQRPCWSHPVYRAWWTATVTDIAQQHPIDGFLLGPERDGPLGPLFNDGDMPGCFCAHCQTRGRAQGIDPERAREGMLGVHRLMTEVRAGRPPREGILLSVLRWWISHPEILAWEGLQNEAKWSLHEDLGTALHRVRPALSYGLHISMYSLVWDLFGRAATDYARLGRIFDYLKPSTYFDVNAARFAGWLERSRKTLYGDLPPTTVADLLYGIMGHQRADEPSFEALATSRCSPTWTRQEIARVVAAVGGQARVYSGIGIDIPHHGLPPIDPADVTAAVVASAEGGADGLLLSREYEFFTDRSLAAVLPGLKAWSRP